jgi:hypothetical protein
MAKKEIAVKDKYAELQLKAKELLAKLEELRGFL